METDGLSINLVNIKKEKEVENNNSIHHVNHNTETMKRERHNGVLDEHDYILANLKTEDEGEEEEEEADIYNTSDDQDQPDQWFNLAQLADVSTSTTTTTKIDESSLQAARTLAELSIMGRNKREVEGRKSEPQPMKICLPNNTTKIIICTSGEQNQNPNSHQPNISGTLISPSGILITTPSMIITPFNQTPISSASFITNMDGVKLPDLRKNQTNTATGEQRR